MTSGPEAGEIRTLVAAALQAPSGDNCQPWRFVWDGHTLQIGFNAERAESLYDVRHLASWIGLGAALTNLRITAAALGYTVQTDLFPDGPDAAGVARVRFSATSPGSGTGSTPGSGTVASAAGMLPEAIARRCANRRPYRDAPLAPALREQIDAVVAATPGTHLDVADRDPGKRRLAAAAALNDRILFENRRLHDGLYRWLRWTAEETARRGDGLPIESLELAGMERLGFRAMAAWPAAVASAILGVTRMLPMRTTGVYRRSSAIALLSVDGARPEDLVRGGEALERIWLTATTEGAAMQPITGVTCLMLRQQLCNGDGLSAVHCRVLDHARRELEAVWTGCLQRTPVMLFRLGYADAPSARAPRLPAESVLTLSPRQDQC